MNGDVEFELISLGKCYIQLADSDGSIVWLSKQDFKNLIEWVYENIPTFTEEL